MRHPPLFDLEKLKKAATRVSQGGPKAVHAFLESEPELGRFIIKTVHAAMDMIFQGKEPFGPEEEAFQARVAQTLSLACSKTLVFTRACYQLVWEETFLSTPTPLPGEAAHDNE